jgi:hypothetical protein
MAEFGHGFVSQSFYVVFFTNVCFNIDGTAVGRATNFFDSILAAAGYQVGDDNFRTLLGKAHRTSAANAAGATGDNDNLAFESAYGHWVFPVNWFQGRNIAINMKLATLSSTIILFAILAAVAALSAQVVDVLMRACGVAPVYEEKA